MSVLNQNVGSVYVDPNVVSQPSIFFSFLAEIVYVDGCIVGLTWGCAICSRCCVIQTRIRLQTPKLPACSARTSVSTTAKCGGLWSRAGRRTDALHCAACHCFLVPFSYQNACICVTKIAEFNCDCCSPVWAAVLPILVGPVETVPISIFTYAGSGIQAQLF